MYVETEIDGMKVKVDRDLVDVKKLTEGMISEVLTVSGRVFEKEKLAEEIARELHYGDVKVDLVDEIDGAYVLQYSFTVAVDEKRWKVKVVLGPASTWEIGGKGFMDHAEFVKWVQRHLE